MMGSGLCSRVRVEDLLDRDLQAFRDYVGYQVNLEPRDEIIVMILRNSAAERMTK